MDFNNRKVRYFFYVILPAVLFVLLTMYTYWPDSWRGGGSSSRVEEQQQQQAGVELGKDSAEVEQ